MVTLVIDTAQSLCSVAILKESGEIYYHESMESGEHSRVLFSLIDIVFESSGCNYSNIINLGVVVGPGSFTGIRAGVAAAKGISIVLGKVLHGISIFEMQAYCIAMSNKDKLHNIKTTFRVRDNLVYSQIFNHELLSLSDIVIDSKIADDYYITDYDIRLNAKIAGSVLYYKLKNCMPTIDSNPMYLDIFDHLNIK